MNPISHKFAPYERVKLYEAVKRDIELKKALKDNDVVLKPLLEKIQFSDVESSKLEIDDLVIKNVLTFTITDEQKAEKCPELYAELCALKKRVSEIEALIKDSMKDEKGKGIKSAKRLERA